MRRHFKWVILLLLMSIWLFSSTLIMYARASERKEVKIDSATLETRTEDILVFMTNRDDGRMSKLKCCLSDQTRIIDEKRNLINRDALKPESVWMILLVYDFQGETPPIIREMHRISDKAPE